MLYISKTNKGENLIPHSFKFKYIDTADKIHKTYVLFVQGQIQIVS